MLSLVRAGSRFAISVLAMAGPALTARAATTLPDPIPVVSGPLTLERALELAAGFQSKPRAAGLRAEAARARIAAAGRRPNPTLTFSEENFGGRLGNGRREATLAISQALEVGGDRKSRTAAAEAEYGLAVAQRAVLGREGLAIAVERFIAAWSLQTRIARLKEGELLTRQAILAAIARHEAGASPRLEVLRAESQATSQAIERRRAESELAIARQDLALQWGAVQATFDSLVAPDALLAPDGPAGSESPIVTHPERRLATAAETLAAARLHLATATRIPDVTVSGGVRRLEEIPGTGFLVGVELPLPLSGTGAGDIVAARRELEAATDDRRAIEQSLRVEFATVLERARSAAAAFDTLRLQVVPAREQLVEELLRGYRSGRFSYLDLVAEQRNLLDAELALVDAQAELWRVRASLALFTDSRPFEPKEAK